MQTVCPRLIPPEADKKMQSMGQRKNRSIYKLLHSFMIQRKFDQLFSHQTAYFCDFAFLIVKHCTKAGAWVILPWSTPGSVWRANGQLKGLTHAQLWQMKVLILYLDWFKTSSLYRQKSPQCLGPASWCRGSRNPPWAPPRKSFKIRLSRFCFFFIMHSMHAWSCRLTAAYGGDFLCFWFAWLINHPWVRYAMHTTGGHDVLTGNRLQPIDADRRLLRCEWLLF